MATPIPPAPVWPTQNVMPKSFFRSAPAGTYSWFDTTRLQAHPATVTSNNGSTLVINSQSTPYTYDLTGDGTACIPVSFCS